MAIMSANNSDTNSDSGSKRSAADADPPNEIRSAARREANRMHALKSRQRSKALMMDLQGSVANLTREKSDLERQNVVLRAQVDVLSQQNRALLQSQQHMFTGINQQPQQLPQTVHSMGMPHPPMHDMSLLANVQHQPPAQNTRHDQQQPQQHLSSMPNGQMNERQIELNQQQLHQMNTPGSALQLSPGIANLFQQQYNMFDPNVIMQTLQQHAQQQHHHHHHPQIGSLHHHHPQQQQQQQLSNTSGVAGNGLDTTAAL